MRGLVFLSVLLVGALAFVLVGLCLPGGAPLMPHLEDSEGCCGLVQCSVLAVSVLVLGLWIVVTLLRLALTASVRSALQPPIAPPPELTFLGSA
jgi:hypothetical protein